MIKNEKMEKNSGGYINLYWMACYWICSICTDKIYYQYWSIQMTFYEKTLIYAEILSIVISAIWIIYKINSMQMDDLIINNSVYMLLIYVSIGNLLKQINKDGD